MSERKIKWVISECSEEQKWDAETESNQALDSQQTERAISEHIKSHFDDKYGSNWHCIVGKNFASFVSYNIRNYLFFYIGSLAILIYKL